MNVSSGRRNVRILLLLASACCFASVAFVIVRVETLGRGRADDRPATKVDFLRPPPAKAHATVSDGEYYEVQNAAGTVRRSSADSAAIDERRRREERLFFPRRGTNEFHRMCGWTRAPPPYGDGNCTLLVRPTAASTEGISAWVSSIVEGYITARQAGCRLLLDYGGPDVDVRRIMEPPLMSTTVSDNNEGSVIGVGTGEAEGLYDWAVPRGYRCDTKRRCFINRIDAAEYGVLFPSRPPLAEAPRYRWALVSRPRPTNRSGRKERCLYDDSFLDLRQRALPGFSLENGFGCSFANVFRRPAAATIAEYEPRLFDTILPAVHDPSALVLAVHLRTGRTDAVAKRKEKIAEGSVDRNASLIAEGGSGFERRAESMLKCVEDLERTYLANHQVDASGRSYSKVVWTVMADSANLKEWVISKYSGRPTHSRPDVRRTVLVTGSTGTHTKAKLNPSEADVARALLDWFLIGESDAVALHMLSFGSTAALRTSRPVYNMDLHCEKQTLVYKRPVQ